MSVARLKRYRDKQNICQIVCIVGGGCDYISKCIDKSCRCADGEGLFLLDFLDTTLRKWQWPQEGVHASPAPWHRDQGISSAEAEYSAST